MPSYSRCCNLFNGDKYCESRFYQLSELALFLSPLLFHVHFLLDLNQAFLYPTFEIRYSFFASPGYWVAVLADKIFVRNFTINAAVFSFCTVCELGLEPIVLPISTSKCFCSTIVTAGDIMMSAWAISRIKAENRIATYFNNIFLPERAICLTSLFRFYQPKLRGLILPDAASETGSPFSLATKSFYLIKRRYEYGVTFGHARTNFLTIEREVHEWLAVWQKSNFVIGDSGVGGPFSESCKCHIRMSKAIERLNSADETEHADYTTNETTSERYYHLTNNWPLCVSPRPLQRLTWQWVLKNHPVKGIIH